MASFDWKSLVAGIAPVLGTALGGPMGGMAAKVIADKVLGKPDATDTEISAALSQGLTPEQIVALKQADNDFNLKMREMDIDVLKINQAGDLAYVADTSDARHTFGKDTNIFIMGVCILLTFAVLMGSVLTGCFLMMTGYFKVDPNVAAICAGLIGTVIGYVAANAQQVVGYFFGNSKGGTDQSNRIGQALTDSIKAAGSNQPNA